MSASALHLVPYERDVDLLLLEEAHVHPAFRAWLVAAVMGSAFDPGPFVTGLHSVDSQFGESDLELRFGGARGAGWRLLVENKIDAALQPRQAERYQIRGRAYVAAGESQAFETVLIAPASYLASGAAAEGFGATVAYERIAAWLEGAPDDARSAYRARVLRRAIDRAQGTGEVAYDALVTAFWQEYRGLVEAEFRHLAIVGKRDAPRRATGTWAEFVPVGLPERCSRIVHDVASGVAYLMFPHMGRELHLLEAALGAPPPAVGAHYEKRGGSGTVTIETPRMRTREPFGPQVDTARDALRAIDVLYRWARRPGADA